jgi:hypothetical protein
MLEYDLSRRVLFHRSALDIPSRRGALAPPVVRKPRRNMPCGTASCGTESASFVGKLISASNLPHGAEHGCTDYNDSSAMARLR